MKRKNIYLIVVLTMLLFIFPMTAFAAAGDHHVEIKVSKAPINYNGKPAMEVAFWIKTGTTKINAIQTVAVAVDLTKFDILSKDGKNANATAIPTDGAVKAFNSGHFAYTEYKSGEIGKVTGGTAFYKAGNSCVVGLMPDWSGGFGQAFPESTKLMSVLVGLKDGVTWENLPADSVRFATAAEAGDLVFSAVVSVNEDGQEWYWQPTGGQTALLTNTPKFKTSGFDFGKETPGSVAPAVPSTDPTNGGDTPDPKIPDTSKPQLFTDVNESDWFSKDVAFVVEKGIMQGMGNRQFAPKASATRSMLIAMLYRLEGSPEVKTSSPFPDVKKGSWYETAVCWAVENGVTAGISATEFRPGMEITREQLVTMLYRYSLKKGYVSTTDTTLDKYTDKDKVSDWAVDAMRWAVDKGIIQGMSEDSLNPKGTATRAQIAAIFTRFIKNIAVK